MYRPNNGANNVLDHLVLNANASRCFEATPAEIEAFREAAQLSTNRQSDITQHRLSPAKSSIEQTLQQQQRRSNDNDRLLSRAGSPQMNSQASLSAVNIAMGRTLPNRDVTPDTIADAYVEFIMYCNPNFPLSTDTNTLRANVQTPPKSDNKGFEVFRLYELIQQFEAKKIKTWGQLALELGVEPPDTSKGQSVQKVQQYSVRLKRWMRAMHVDAFFEYLLGKDHTYYKDIPPLSDPYPKTGRDGVVAEDDLAIRALDPAFRPKRGRRRNSDAEIEDDAEDENSEKRQRFGDGSMSAIPASGIPMSAFPDKFHDPWAVASAVTPQTFAPWGNRRGEPQTAISTTAPSQFRWQLHGDAAGGTTPHPMSAYPTSMEAVIDDALGEPKSAITPAGRKRRKHGPAVSSAWPSVGASGTKPRGRPPASRTIQDGPFTTFPACPPEERSTAMQTVAPNLADTESHPDMSQDETIQIQHLPPPLRHNDTPTRPARLSLQVPPHTGGAVRLATPPRVLLNDPASNPSVHVTPPAPLHPPPPPFEVPPQPANPQRPRRIHDFGEIQVEEREIPGFAFEVLKRALSSDLLRAEVVGRDTRLTGEEAKRLADAILVRFDIPRADTYGSRDDIARLTAASWLGLGEKLRVPLGPAVGRNKKITITRFRIDAEGYEEIIPPNDHERSAGEIREVYDLSWNVGMGGCDGAFVLKGITLGDPEPPQEDTHDFVIRTWMDSVRNAGLSEEWANKAIKRSEKVVHPMERDKMDKPALDDAAGWRARYMESVFGASMAQGEYQRIRDLLVERVLDVLI